MGLAKVAIVGVGLIGGSLAAAWRAAGFAREIVGIETDPAAAAYAEQHLVDKCLPSVPDDAQLIAVCTASDQIAATVAQLAHHGAVIFDVGSVKGAIVEDLQQNYGGVPTCFVPAHPIAGSERSGPQAASQDLFAGATTVLTPLDNTDAHALQQVQEAWQAVGCDVAVMTPAEHDRMLALTSHLPHLLAFSFMQQVDTEHLPFIGGGFKDFTRIAAAHPQLWWRILSLNKTQVLAAASEFSAHLRELTEALQEGDAERGLAMLDAAVKTRQEADE